jgi:hypothetical protein
MSDLWLHVGGATNHYFSRDVAKKIVIGPQETVDKKEVWPAPMMAQHCTLSKFTLLSK